MRLLFLSIPLLFLTGCAAVPEAKYDLLSKSGIFETRTYHPRIVAVTLVDASYEDAPNIGFRRLANYIFGSNTKSASIEMTAPVDVAPRPAKESEGSNIEMTAPVEVSATDKGRYAITFTMPEEYTMGTLPRPTDPLIDIVQQPAKTYAVVCFSGTTESADIKKQAALLRQFIANHHLTELPRPISIARYDPPWVLPWFRRNEVLIEIQKPDTK